MLACKLQIPYHLQPNVCTKMLNWLKNTFQKLTDQDDQVNYVIAEYHATKSDVNKRRRAIKDDPIENDFETDRNATGEYMQIDRLHQNN
jgi:hypothetical protein